MGAPPPGWPGPPPPPPPPPPQQQQGGTVGADGIKRRAPLPDQQDALKAEMNQGRYRKAR
jgi:polyadenylation factor subunit 2